MTTQHTITTKSCNSKTVPVNKCLTSAAGWRNITIRRTQTWDVFEQGAEGRREKTRR
jgi:hypothetical protein